MTVKHCGKPGQHAPSAPACPLDSDIISLINTTGNTDTIQRLRRDYWGYPDDTIDETDAADYDEYVAAAGRRWRPVTAIAAGVLVLAVIATAVIVNGGDSASTNATVRPSAPRTVIATPRPTSSPPPQPSLSPETVTTLPPRSPRNTPPSSTEPSATVPPQASPSTPPPAPAVDPRTVVYQVTGTKQAFDLVSVIYTDAQGLPHTDVNVSLPWTKTVVLNPGVQLKSVIATSLTGRLNCTITDAAGQTIVTSTNNAMIATCTR